MSPSYEQSYERSEKMCDGRMKLTGEYGGLAVAIKGWLASNQWPQLIFEQWAKEVEPDAPGLYASQIGKLLRNELEPYPFFFKALALFNHDVAQSKVEGIRSSALKKRLIEGEPFVVSGWDRVATSTDFYQLFIGELEVPAIYREAS